MQFGFPSRISIPTRITLPSIDPDWWTRQCCSWSVALLLCGQQFFWVIRGYAGQNDNPAFSLFPIVLGTALLVRLCWIFGVKIHSSKVALTVPLLLALVPYTVFSMTHAGELVVQLVYLVIMCTFTLLATFNRPGDFKNVPIAIMILGGAGCILTVMALVLSPVQAALRLGINGTDNPLAAAANGTFTICSALIVGATTGKNKWLTGALAAVCLFAGATNIILSGTRSAIVAVFGCIALYVLVFHSQVRRTENTTGGRNKRLYGFFGMLALIVVTLPLQLALAFNPRYLLILTAYLQDHFSTIFDVFNTSKKSFDTSMELHYYLMDYTWKNISWFGNGINYIELTKTSGEYAHMIYIQAFCDFGMVGGLLLLVTSAVIPMAIIALRIASGRMSGTHALVIILFLYDFVQLLSHGSPYSWQLWLPVLLVYTLVPPGAGANGDRYAIDFKNLHRLKAAFAPRTGMPQTWRTALVRITHGRTP